MSSIYKRVLTYVLDDKLIVNYFFVATDRWTYLTAIHLEAAISYTHTLTYLPLHENLSKSHTHTHRDQIRHETPADILLALHRQQ